MEGRVRIKRRPKQTKSKVAPKAIYAVAHPFNCFYFWLSLAVGALLSAVVIPQDLLQHMHEAKNVTKTRVEGEGRDADEVGLPNVRNHAARLEALQHRPGVQLSLECQRKLAPTLPWVEGRDDLHLVGR